MRSQKSWGIGRVLGIFVAGLLTLLPLGGTLLILGLSLSIAYEWLGPSSRLGAVLVGLGVGIGGGDSDIFRYLLGLSIVAGVVFVIGLLAEMGLRRGMRDISDQLMGRIPVAKSVYETLGNFIALFSKKNKGGGGMAPVWCFFGETNSVAVLGLLSTPNTLNIKGKEFFAVIIPTSPVPVGGGLFFLEKGRVFPADGVGIEGLTSMYVSMGVTAPQFVK
jgi:uncharacterized membrane protein